MGSIAEKWKVFSGENDWKGLLDHPLDNDFRRYIIHYGERNEALGDAFIAEEKSKNYGRSRYAKRDFFSKVGLEKGNPYKYEVTNFIYAALELKPPSLTATWKVIKQSNLMAYVAVATDDGKAALGRRDILVSWRGTMLDPEWIKDLDFASVSASKILGTANEPKVHNGWYSLYTGTNPDSPLTSISARDQIINEIKKQVAGYKDEDLSITFVGHSMGAAIATLNATDIVFNGFNKLPDKPDKAIPVTAFCIACPRIGDDGFSKVFAGLIGSNLHVLRINNYLDIVPKYPPGYYLYSDVGQELVVDSLESPYLKKALLTLHSLEVHLHTVAGYQGPDKEFDLKAIARDKAFLNKYGDYLDDEYRVVAEWWTEKNKSMIQNDDGTWELKDSEEEIN